LAAGEEQVRGCLIAGSGLREVSLAEGPLHIPQIEVVEVRGKVAVVKKLLLRFDQYGLKIDPFGADGAALAADAARHDHPRSGSLEESLLRRGRHFCIPLGLSGEKIHVLQESAAVLAEGAVAVLAATRLGNCFFS